MKVQLVGSARTYFRQEVTYLRQRSHPAAEAFRARIAEALKTLARFPAIGVSHDGVPVPGVSRLIVGDYLLDYRRRDDRILVISIRHGRQAQLHPAAEDPTDYEAPEDAS